MQKANNFYINIYIQTFSKKMAVSHAEKLLPLKGEYIDHTAHTNLNQLSFLFIFLINHYTPVSQAN